MPGWQNRMNEVFSHIHPALAQLSFTSLRPTSVTNVLTSKVYPGIHFRTTALGQGANMALPIYALFQQRINRDSKYKQISNASFPTPSSEILRELDCDPFKDDVNFWEALFGSKEEREARRDADKKYSTKPVPKKKDKGIFKGLRNLFKKKD